MFSLRTLQLAGRYQLLALVLTALTSAWLWPDQLGAICAGGALMGVSFFASRFLGERALKSERGKIGYTLALAFKLVVLMGAMGVLLVKLQLAPLGFSLGMFTLLIGIGLATTHVSLGDKPAQVS